MISRQPFRSVFAIALTAAVFLAAFFGTRLFPHRGVFPSSFVTDCLMLGLSVVVMALISKGRFALFGFTLGSYKFSPLILLWVLPSAIPTVLQGVTLPPGATPHSFVHFTVLQTIVFIWICSSFCEEVLVRGLLQTMLGPRTEAAAPDPRWWTIPSVISAVFFGAMHLVLVPLLGPAAIPIILMATFLGFVAAHYRQATGSLLPAIGVHMLFNIGGSLPLWLILWMRR